MLDKMNKENPFKVPENYFNSFHKDIMGKIQEERTPKKVSMWKRVLPWTGAAAILCGAVISFNVLTSDKQSGQLAQTDQKTEMYASSEEEYFMLFLEDETLGESYNEYIFTNLSN